MRLKRTSTTLLAALALTGAAASGAMAQERPGIEPSLDQDQPSKGPIGDDNPVGVEPDRPHPVPYCEAKNPFGQAPFAAKSVKLLDDDEGLVHFGLDMVGHPQPPAPAIVTWHNDDGCIGVEISGDLVSEDLFPARARLKVSSFDDGRFIADSVVTSDEFDPATSSKETMRITDLKSHVSQEVDEVRVATQVFEDGAWRQVDRAFVSSN